MELIKENTELKNKQILYISGIYYNPTTGSTARFGVKILETGVYRARYCCNVENETFGDRLIGRTALGILYTNSSGSETYTLLNHSISTEYLRHASFGQFCNMSNFS